jgi:methanethiol S-methyltransferase
VLRRTYALLAYAAFVAVSGWGVLFLADLGPLPTVDGRPGPWAVPVDLGLWLLFALPHSLLARRAVGRSTYVLVAALALALLFWQWRALSGTVWDVDQPWLWAGYGAGWAVAIAATYMVDHWEFVGLRAGTGAGLSRRRLYGWVRHPMMTGLLVASWVTPRMTAGHLLYAAASTAYIVVGVRFEERALRRQLPGYPAYAREVPRFVPRPRRTIGPGPGRQVIGKR